jgi:hypothetical protein
LLSFDSMPYFFGAGVFQTATALIFRTINKKPERGRSWSYNNSSTRCNSASVL